MIKNGLVVRIQMSQTMIAMTYMKMIKIININTML
jgi:hypothetical protein